MALRELSEEQKSTFRELDCRIWDKGAEIPWHERGTYFGYNKYPWILKGDHGSQLDTDHVSIGWTEFNEFLKHTNGIVWMLTGRFLFERELVFVFSDTRDMTYFKLKFSGNERKASVG